jgi:Flp pilus assembly protein TadG
MNKPMMKHVMESLNNSRGVTAVVVAIFLTVVLAMGAAAIDIGHALVARNELQNVSDAAALAGTRALGIIYEGMTPAAQQSYTLTGGDKAIVEAAVQATANANSAAGVSITIAPSDIAIGLWDPATRTHTPTVNQPKAVRVMSRRDASANGAISTFLANVVGMSSISVGAVATADMTAVGQTGPGELNVPFAISEYYFTQFGCGDSIKFYPNDGTPQACSAWQTFNQSPSNANTLKQIINGMIPTPPTDQSPATAPGDSLNFTNGNVASAFPNLINLFNAKKDSSAVPPSWDVFVPV